MSAGPKTLTQWVATALAAIDKFKSDGVTHAQCIGFSVNHVGGTIEGGGIEREIHGINVGGKKFDDRGVADLSAAMYGACETDAQNLRGAQQYVIYALFEDPPPGPPRARYPLRVNGHIVNAPGDLSTEPPTDEGRRAQRMRHDEAYSQILITASTNIINMQSAFLKVQNDALLQKTQENLHLTEAVHKMLIEKIAMDREHDLKVLQYQRTNELIQGAVKLAPALMNQVTGREIVPQNTADTAILEAIAEAIDEESMQQIMPVLAKIPPAAQGLLMGRLQQITEQKQKAQKRVENSLAKMDPNAIAEAELGEDKEDKKK